jgi:hypothetical protein
MAQMHACCMHPVRPRLFLRHRRSTETRDGRVSVRAVPDATRRDRSKDRHPTGAKPSPHQPTPSTPSLHLTPLCFASPSMAGKSRFLRSPYQYRPPQLPLSTGSVRVTRRPRKIIYLLGIFFLLYWFGIRHGLGIERQVPPPLGFAIPGGRRGRRSALRYDARGMATLQSTLPGTHPDHPIYELMEHAERRWNRLLKSQSTTLERAVDEYRRRYRMDPPAGFDAWFAWCKSHGVTIVDEYDQLMKDLLIHHALPPAMFIARSEALEGGDFTYTLDVTAQGVDLSGPRAPHARPRKLQSLIQGFQNSLPKDFHLRVTGSDHDTGSQVVGRDQRERAMDLVRKGERE